MNVILNHKKKVLALGVTIVGARYLCSRSTRKCGVDYPRDTVILHTWPRMKFIPQMDPFSLKVETYLRANDIPYKLDEESKNGPKGDSCIPWIEYNDKRLADHDVITKYLSGTLNKDMNEHLSMVDKEKATEIQKWLENRTYWVTYHTRWYVYWDDMLVNLFECPTYVNNLIRRPARLYQKIITKKHGIDGKSDDEVNAMLVEDLRKFSDILGEKDFVMGNHISEVDCIAFSIISQIRWCWPKESPGHQLLTGGEMQNVMDYLDRIRNLYWSDWEELMKSAKCKS